jgi:diguanylate cyclase (GGDEF)-like protein
MSDAKKAAHILVVDDEERNRRLLVTMLEAEGYSTSQAADGTQALDMVRSSAPDLVLLDIMMPGIDGYEVARALKADAATRFIPIVMVTALDERSSRLRGLEAGAEEFVGKPVDRHELRIRVRNLLRLKEYGDLLADHNRILDAQVQARTAEVVRLNRVYAMLSGINTLIVRVRERDLLFREACRIAVETGGFRISWIGLVDRGAMTIVQFASNGVAEDLVERIKTTLASDERAPPGSTMASQAIRQKRPFIANDLQNSPRFGFGKNHAQAGILSIAVLPLLVSDQAVGVFALGADEVEFFHAEEIKLLTDLAGDIAFAIEHIDKQERLDYLAYYDALTGLANRNLFLDRATQCLRSAADGAHRMALFLIDLERFNSINDSLGRPAGDLLLRQVAQWLTDRNGNPNLLARVGADQFAGLLPVVRPGGNLVHLLEATRRDFLAHPFDLNGTVLRVAARSGVALFPDDGADAETLLRYAQAALKQAKASGEPYLFYTRNMTEARAGRMDLENRLRLALDQGEFVLHYQPKVNLVSGRITGVEALIRWNDPQTGLVPPGRFIPILEETGLIHEVGRWALQQAMADYLRWQAMGLAAVPIAVNASALQLRHRGFIADIGQVIGIDPKAAAGLELEITESLIMDDVEHNIANLKAIRALGVTIAIDDFGTGFSSLSYLSKLPVDTLKIDRSFVIDMALSPEGLSLVSTIINLAHSLKLKVVAEGVETEEQARLLRLLDCDEMQGYLFSKPVACAVLEAKYMPRDRADVAGASV